MLMLELKDKNTTALSQKERQRLDHLNFDFLREKGLEHIGQFSGKIWTDHNTHDPGITILETLCYALMDLGYRTQLPIEDLLAKPNPKEKDDNFFSPAEILTCNPVTILDFRKLLMEIEDVKNAWLEIAEDCELNSKKCGGDHKFFLNGIYHVFIEKMDSAREDEEIVEDVRDLLSAHRNLCEDFQTITILCQQQIGLCVDIEIYPDANPKEVYLQILEELRNFIAPSPIFYSLQDLLEKGKSIEAIFAGIPYFNNLIFSETDPLKNGSFGFIDVEELEKITHRKEIHKSDLYTVIHQVKGVKTIRKLCLSGEIEERCHKNIDDCEEAWVYQLNDNHIAAFDLAGTTINLSNNNGIININSEEVKQELTSLRKVKLDTSNLDLALPKGFYREDLADYVSIQNEFPRIYGIGQTGLPGDSPLRRKAQAKQLQAFLLFFDQLLANYLEQLGKLRQLFSLKQESEREEKRTIFSKNLTTEEVPEIDQLYRLNTTSSANSGYLVPVKKAELDQVLCKIEERFNKTIQIDFFNDCHNLPVENGIDLEQCAYKKLSRRNAIIDRIQLDFETGNFFYEDKLDSRDFYFILYPISVPELALIPTERYATKKEAIEARELAIFTASWEQNFTQINHPLEGSFRYSFWVSAQRLNYRSLIASLTETEENYFDRRDQFLNHLLNRFSESFADYAALMFNASQQNPNQAKKNAVHAKSEFLSLYDEISRNRGKAFDYRNPSWGTKNISGFEHRVSQLTNYGNRLRSNVCNIDIKCSEGHGIIIKDDPDEKGQLLLYSKDWIPSEAYAQTVTNELYKKLEGKQQEFPLKIGYHTDTGNYFLTANILNYQINLANDKPLKTQAEAEKKLNEIKTLFFNPLTEKREDELAFEYSIHLSQNNQHLNPSKRFNSADQAKDHEADFIEIINKDRNSGMFLLPLQTQHSYLNIDNLSKNYVKTVDDRYFIEYLDQKTGDYLATKKLFDAQHEATSEALKDKSISKYIFPTKNAQYWELETEEGWKLSSTQFFDEESKLDTNWKLAKKASSNKANFQLEKWKDGQFQVVLRKSKKGRVIAKTNNFEQKEETQLAYIKTVLRECFEKDKPKLKKQAGSWGFHFFNSEDEKTLCNYDVFPSQVEAYRGLQRAIQCLPKSSSYLRDHNHMIDADHTFYLKEGAQNYIAESPKVFNTSKKRDDRIEELIKQTTWLPPFRIQAQTTFGFAVSGKKGTASAKSITKYTKVEAATEATQHFLIQLLNNEKFETKEIAKNSYSLKYPFDKKEHELSLSNDGGLAVDKVLENFRREMAHLVYQVVFDQKTIAWQFVQTLQFSEELGAFDIRSVNKFKSKKEMDEAFAAFKQDFFEYEKAPKGNIFCVKKEGETAPKQRTDLKNICFEVVESEAYEVARATAELDNFLKARKKRKGITHKEKAVVPKPTGGDKCPEATYQFIKKGNPLVYHRCWINPEIPIEDPCQKGNEEKKDFEETVSPLDTGRPCLEQLISEKYNQWNADLKNVDTPKEDITDCCANKNNDPNFNKKADLEKKLAKYSKIPLKEYCWLELCPNVPIIEQRPTGEAGFCKYHYVIKGAYKKQFAHLNLLTSIQGYDSEAEAEAAYFEDFWEILEIAAYPANYGTQICMDNCFDLPADTCGEVQGFKAVLHEDFKNHYPLNQANIASRLFRSFPIRYFQADHIFYFQLYHFPKVDTPIECAIPIWTSWNCFPSYEIAQNEFNGFMDLLSNEDCKVACRGGQWYLEIAEVLMESCKIFPTKDAAWGRDCANTMIPSGEDPITGCTEEFDPCKGSGAELFLHAAQCEGAFVPYQNEDGSYGFMVVDDCYEVHCHPCEYDTFGDAEAVKNEVLELLCEGTWLNDAVIDFYHPEYKDLSWLEKEDCPNGRRKRDKAKEINKQIKQLVFLLKQGYQPDEIQFCVKIISKNKKAYTYTSPCEEEVERPFECDYFFKFEGAITNAYDKELKPISETVTNEINAAIIAYLKETDLVKKLLKFKKDETLFDQGLELLTNLSIQHDQPIANLEDILQAMAQYERTPEYELKKGKEELSKYGPLKSKIQAENQWACEIKSDDPCGPFSFRLIDKCCILAKSPTRFSTASARDAAMNRAKACVMTEGLHLVEHVLLRPPYEQKKELELVEECMFCGCPDCNCTLQWEELGVDDFCKPEEDAKIEYLPFADAYSFWGTVVLPAWIKRFKTEEARAFFEKILHRESPAHVALNILWLSPRQFCEFEACFRAWLDSMSCPSVGNCKDANDTENGKDGDCEVDLSKDLRCEMIKCMKRLCNTITCEEENVSSTCDCDETTNAKPAQNNRSKVERFNILKCKAKDEVVKLGNLIQGVKNFIEKRAATEKKKKITVQTAKKRQNKSAKRKKPINPKPKKP